MNSFVEFLFPCRLHRLAYFLRVLVLTIATGVLYASSSTYNPRFWWPLVIVLGVYSWFYVALPRVRDIGMNGMWLLLLFVPVVDIMFSIILLLRAPALLVRPRLNETSAPNGSTAAAPGNPATPDFPSGGRLVADPSIQLRSDQASSTRRTSPFPRPKNLTATCSFILIAGSAPGVIVAGMLLNSKGMSPEALLTILLTALIAVCPIAMFLGKEWGRTLFTILSVVGLGTSLEREGLGLPLLMGLVVAGIFLFFLYDPKITAFFRQTEA